MKKYIDIKTIMLALSAMLTFSLTSCDDDDLIARTLEGTWEGDMYVSTYWGNQYYDASYSEICFSRDPYRYSSGTGYWIDYYDDYSRYGWGRNYIANHIEWEVVNRNIRVYFVEDKSDVVIYDYALDNAYFTGWIDLYDGSRQRFNLRHVASPNWNNYYWGYDDFYYYSNENKLGFDEGMSKVKAKAGVTTDATENTPTTDQPQRVFRARE